MAKSDKDQYKYREISCDLSVLNKSYLPTNADIEDEIKELKEELLEKMLFIINHKLTERQRQVVIATYFQQKTQMEIAAQLGLCQTTIHKVLKGNIDYKANGKRYGGVLKKMQKLCSSDKEIQDILIAIQEKTKESTYY